MNDYITVAASYSNDTLINAQGKLLATKAGGPALFIERVLRSEKLPYKLTTGEPLDVEILVTQDGEFGRISQTPLKQPINFSGSEWAIASTILDEWQILEPLPDKLFVDLQGYVRNGANFGGKKSSNILNGLAGKAFCFKGTKEETSYLSRAAIKRQKNKLLVITNGSYGIDLYYFGEHCQLPVSRVDNLTDTIGAGDTFFAYFVASIFRGRSPIAASKYALEQTTQFLKSKYLVSLEPRMPPRR